ncbi:MAG: TIGR00730 family Rossman fold protein [Bacteroidota bacterium]
MGRKRVCIFCGAKLGNRQEILAEVDLLIKRLIEADYDLVYGGGRDGIMGRIANQFLEGRKTVIGIRPEKLIVDEAASGNLTELVVVKDMYERKSRMIEESDLFIALPGGIGTLDEILEVYTHVKLGYVDKPCAVLNFNGFFDGLDTLLAQMVNDGFLYQHEKEILIFANSAEELMDKL